MSDMETLRRDIDKLRECYDTAIRERDDGNATIEMMRTTISDSDVRIVELTRHCDQTRRERDAALLRIDRAEREAHWSERAMTEAHDRCAELRESVKSARWNAVYGAMVAVQMNGAMTTMVAAVAHASRIADQAEEAWESLVRVPGQE